MTRCPPTCPHPPPGIRLRTMRAARAMSTWTWDRTTSPPASTRSIRMRTISSASRSTLRPEPPIPIHQPMPARLWSSFISLTICAWANTSPCSAASASPFTTAATTNPLPTRASARPSKFPACAGFCAAFTATSSSPRRCSPSPAPCSTTPAACRREKTPSLPYLQSATKNTSSAFSFPIKAGRSTWIPSKIASTTFSITPTWANRICTSPSPSMERWCAPGR